MADRNTYVALLRGINVGGKHPLPMKELAAIFVEAKCCEVRTYIQSGNVIFAATCDAAQRLPATIGKKIETRFGFTAPVILRSRDELTQVIRENPFLKFGLPENTLHTYFLADLPAAAAVKSLDPSRSPPDEFVVLGRHIYLRTPNGMGRTKLTSTYFDTKLSTIATARNWATVKKLLEMMQS